MDASTHAFHNLFEQLGLPNDDVSIRRFIETHSPLANDIYLADAPFWTPAQASFLREEILEDADWAEVVDQLAMERESDPHRFRMLVGVLRTIADNDNPLVVPVDQKVRIVTTANDVIHAWMVPAFGVKQDAIPGFVRDTWFRAEKTGDFYGQCAELCGKEHAYMPIHVKVLSQEDYSR